MKQPQNPTPKIFLETTLPRRALRLRSLIEDDESTADPVDVQEIFDQIRHLNDPEYPLTLEQLNIVTVERITIDQQTRQITIKFTPTIPHCSMATMIGLMIKIKLSTSMPRQYKVQVLITEGAHVNEKELNKQLNDKERISAAIENPNIFRVVKKGIVNTDRIS